VLTGVSSADLGGSIPHDLPGSNLSVSESIAPIDISLSHSKRPQTRPTSGSQSGSLNVSGGVSGKPRVIEASSLVQGANPLPPALGAQPSLRPPAVKHPPNPEAAFADISDDITPSGMVRQRANAMRGDVGRLTKLAPVLAGCALLLALSVLAYVYTSAPHKDRVDGAQEIARPTEVKVTFASTPAGAEVYDGSVRLGTTPLVRPFALDETRDHPKKFTFKLQGFMDEVISEKLETASVKIHARMRAVEPAAQPEDEPGKKGEGSEYKENPY
jgi:hypothetical protein